MIKKIYFAHPVTMYDTEKEKKIIHLIEKQFPDSIVINPADKVNQLEFKQYKYQYGENYMQYFFDLVATCDSIVVYPFEDGTIGAGKGQELEYALKMKIGAYLIDNMTLEFKEIFDIDEIDILSVEETRKKIKQIRGEK